MARLEAGMTAGHGRRSHPASQHRLEIGDEPAVIVAGQGPPRQEAEAMGACVIEPVLQGTAGAGAPVRSEEHTSELQSLMRISYAVFCLNKKKLHTPDSSHIA